MEEGQLEVAHLVVEELEVGVSVVEAGSEVLRLDIHALLLGELGEKAVSGVGFAGRLSVLVQDRPDLGGVGLFPDESPADVLRVFVGVEDEGVQSLSERDLGVSVVEGFLKAVVRVQELRRVHDRLHLVLGERAVGAHEDGEVVVLGEGDAFCVVLEREFS